MGANSLPKTPLRHVIDYPVNHVPRTVALSEQVIKPNFSLRFFAPRRKIPLAASHAQTARWIILRVVVLLLVLLVVG